MLINLGGVTETLENLIKWGIEELGGPIVQTTARPPDLTSPGEISVHLYHALESPEFKNLPPVGGTGRIPSRFSPTALILQYIVSLPAGGDSDPEGFTDYEGQTALGYAVRVLRDYPRVDDALSIDGHSILATGMNGEPIEFHLRPAKLDEAVGFWGAEQTMAPRLSLFIEARVAVLEPREPEFIPGRVLSIGGGIVPTRGPQLLSSRSELAFVPPSLTGLALQSLPAVPARPTLIDPAAEPDPALANNDRVVFSAQGLAPERSLLLSTERFEPATWSDDQRVTAIEVPLDRGFGENAAWDFSATSGRLSFRVRTTVTARRPGSAETLAFSLRPGSYTARIVQKDERLGGFSLSSNASAFSVTPQTLGITSLGGGLYEVSVSGDYLPDVAEQAALAVGGLRLTRVESDPPAAGQFLVEAGSGQSSVVRFGLPAGLSPTAENPVAVNLIVNGQTATPEWLEA